MRVWTAYEPRVPASPEERADRTIFVKDGFAWLAFLLPLPWLLVHRLWLGTLIYVAISVAAGVAGGFLSITENAGAALALIGNLYAGLESNDLIRRKLSRQGFVHAGSVLAKNRTEAELQFFAARGSPEIMAVSRSSVPTVSSPTNDTEGVLGLFPRPEGSR